MPLCPRCENPVNAADLTCGSCGLVLKAHGHPSIELHQATGETVLCQDCAYDADDSCTFPQRPYAKTCTLYQPVQGKQEEVAYQPRSPRFSTVWQRHKIWFILLVLFGLSLLITVL